MPQLLQYCDVVISDIWSIEKTLKLKLADVADTNIKQDYVQQEKKTSEEIIKQFSKCKIVANTFSFNKGVTEYYATVFSSNNLYVSATYRTDEAVDKAGSEDCFAAGLIYGVYNHLPCQQIINFSAGASFQKLLIKGDFTDKTTDEIKSFILHYT